VTRARQRTYYIENVCIYVQRLRRSASVSENPKRGRSQRSEYLTASGPSTRTQINGGYLHTPRSEVSEQQSSVYSYHASVMSSAKSWYPSHGHHDDGASSHSCLRRAVSATVLPSHWQQTRTGPRNRRRIAQLERRPADLGAAGAGREDLRQGQCDHDVTERPCRSWLETPWAPGAAGVG
jgi:hypothetical protein